MPDSQPDVSELAREVVDELKDTRQIGDQLLLSRREAIALSTGAVSLGALGVAGAGSANAQEAAGQIGTESERVNVFANELDVNNLTLDEAIDLVDGDVDFGGNDINNFGTASGEDLEAESADIANETLIRSKGLDSAQSINQDEWEKLNFGEGLENDERDEFDISDHTFSPDESGYYLISLKIRFEGGSNGDHRQVSVFENGSNFIRVVRNNSDIDDTLQYSTIDHFSSGAAYSINARNFDSSDQISTNFDDTELAIRSVFRSDQ